MVGPVAVIAVCAVPASSAVGAGCPSGQVGTPPYCQKIVRKHPTSFTATTRPGRDRRSPYRFTTSGRLGIPSSVGQAKGCTGVVAIRYKRGANTISLRRVHLHRKSGHCVYSSRVTFHAARFKTLPSQLRVQARFQGNQFLLARTHSEYHVIVG
jgi:hypothetical protein